MEYLIIALILAKFCERGAIDIISMATGRQPPSATYRAAKGGTSEDGPLTKMIKAWWADAVEDVDEARRRHRMNTKEEKDRARKERKAERQRVIDEAEKTRTRTVEEEAREDTPPADEVPVEDLPEVKDYATDEEGPRQSEGRSGERPRGVEEDTVADIPPVTEETEKPAYTPDTRPVPEPIDPYFPPESEKDTEWRPMFPPEGAKVIPMFKEKTEEAPTITVEVTEFDEDGPAVLNVKGTEPMTTSASAPEGGLGQHQRWTVSMSDWERKAIPQVEMVGAAMRAGEVGPEYLAIVAEIQDLHRIQAEKYAILYKKLASMNEIKEKYAANPDAGGKPYVTSE